MLHNVNASITIVYRFINYFIIYSYSYILIFIYIYRWTIVIDTKIEKTCETTIIRFVDFCTIILFYYNINYNRCIIQNIKELLIYYIILYLYTGTHNQIKIEL